LAYRVSNRRRCHCDCGDIRKEDQSDTGEDHRNLQSKVKAVRREHLTQGKKMNRSKIQRLTAAGWKVSTPKELLNLSDEEESLIEMKLALAGGLRKLRAASGLTQSQLAERLGSSQSRVAKIESADRTVSIDLLVRSLLALGANRRDVGRIVGRSATIPAA